jgi:hypothetical protein
MAITVSSAFLKALTTEIKFNSAKAEDMMFFIGKGGENMFWRKVFGDTMFEKVQKYAKDRNFTISTLVRLAVEKYMKGE